MDFHHFGFDVWNFVMVLCVRLCRHFGFHVRMFVFMLGLLLHVFPCHCVVDAWDTFFQLFFEQRLPSDLVF